MRSALCLLALLAACSSSAASSGEGSSGGEQPVVLTRVRADLVCTEEVPSGEALCVSQGCQWQAPLFCSGVQVPPETIQRYQSDATRACTCVCEDDMMECMSRP